MSKTLSAKPVRATQQSVPADLADYTFEQLLELKAWIDGEVDSRKEKEITRLRAQMTETAQSLGVSVHELLGVPRPAMKRETKHAPGPQPVKYRGPGGEEWSGRGPAPKWLKMALAKGRTREEFEVESAA